MRLLLVAQDFPPGTGGIQTYAAELAARLSLRCAHFAVLAPALPGAAAFDATCEYPVHRLPGSPDLFPMSSLVSLPRLARRERIDVVFCVQWQPAASALVARALTGYPRRIAVAAHARELLLRPPVPLISTALDRLRRWVLTHADALFPVSRYTAGLLEHAGVRAERITVVPNGTDPERFHPGDGAAREALRPGDGPALLTVGRLVPRKGIDTVLRALPRLLAGRPDVTYLIGGDGPDRGRLEALAAELGVAESVRFLGAVAASALPALYAACDVFVMPSRGVPPDVEGFGIVFLEASACGTPVVGARTGGIPDAVADGETGLLVEPDQPDELAGALLRLVRDPAYAERLGAQGRQRVVSRFTWDHAAAALYDALERLR